MTAVAYNMLKRGAVRKENIFGKKYCENTGKLHVPCPHKARSGVFIHVVIRDGQCYRSKDCLVFDCKFNTLQNDLDSIVSVVW